MNIFIIDGDMSYGETHRTGNILRGSGYGETCDGEIRNGRRGSVHESLNTTL